MSLRVAVLMGGPSAEAEVSRNSATQVAAALEQQQHTIEKIELDTNAAKALEQFAPDVVFPALHGPPGEDGTVQGFLEILGYQYVGSGVHGSAVAMDKSVAKQIFAEHDLPTLPDLVVSPGDSLSEAEEAIRTNWGPAVVIKPLNQGSAIGVTPLPNGGDIEAALETALQYGPCLVEPYLMGKEITVGVLERDGELIPHPVIEIRTASDEWYDYENRYAAGQSEHVIPAPLSSETQSELQRIAVCAHQLLGLRDLSRADFIVTEEEKIALLEVNTLPGMTPTSLYPDGARHLGYEFDELMDLLVKQASLR